VDLIEHLKNAVHDHSVWHGSIKDPSITRGYSTLIGQMVSQMAQSVVIIGNEPSISLSYIYSVWGWVKVLFVGSQWRP